MANKYGFGDFRIPVTFYGPSNEDSPEPNSTGQEEVYSALCFAYAPSSKDYTILNDSGIKQGVTLIMPDTRGEFIPNSTMTAIISDYRYRNIEWNIIEVRPDFDENRFVTIVLGVIQ
ncbi:hypothetical protein [Ligilactobacillus agilis]|uniref:hypothetical protein n=1 Tax=Ligilactobacillus agilis TaxID=1601 RepID=UPI001FC7FF06|nr:hypothetical protein [Ligilactobacillus agilis]